MLTTRQLFITNYCAAVFTFRVTGSTQFCIYIATDVGTTMLATRLELVTNSRTLEITKLVNFFMCHYFMLLVKRIIHLVAEEFAVFSVASALFDDDLLALHTLVSVAFFNTLMGATGQISLTECFTCRYRLSAHNTLSPNQFLD